MQKVADALLDFEIILGKVYRRDFVFSKRSICICVALLFSKPEYRTTKIGLAIMMITLTTTTHILFILFSASLSFRLHANNGFLVLNSVNQM